MTPKRLHSIARTLLALLTVAAAVLLFGPFAGVERYVRLTDKEAHLLSFYGLTLLSFFAFPSRRRNDLAVSLILVAGATEIIQAMVGRDGDIFDWAADVAGIGLTMAPVFVEQLRRAVREGANQPLAAALSRADRRRNAARPADIAAPGRFADAI